MEAGEKHRQAEQFPLSARNHGEEPMPIPVGKREGDLGEALRNAGGRRKFSLVAGENEGRAPGRVGSA